VVDPETIALVPTKRNASPSQKGLIKVFVALNDQDKASLVAFAEFLRARAAEKEPEAAGPPPEPKPTPRPRKESVVGAIKRLSDTYYMLDRSALLNETSSLMTSHVMQGREASKVIDDLETMFARQFEEFVSSAD